MSNLEWMTYSENSNHSVNVLNRPGQRKVAQICKTTGIVLDTYDNITKASKATGTRSDSIVHNCKGRFKSANGFIWKYI
jgi:hypothetical protein